MSGCPRVGRPEAGTYLLDTNKYLQLKRENVGLVTKVTRVVTFFVGSQFCWRASLVLWNPRTLFIKRTAIRGRNMIIESTFRAGNKFL